MESDSQTARDMQSLEAADRILQTPPARDRDANGCLSDTVSQLLDRLGQRTVDLLAQRRQLLDLQALYRALLHCGDVLIQSRREQEMLVSLCAKLAQDTPFHAAWIGRPDSSHRFDVLAVAGEGTAAAHAALAPSTPGNGVSFVERAWTGKQLVVCNDTLADRTLRPWHEVCVANRWLSVLATPIFRAEQPWAVLALAAARRDGFDASTVEVCTRIGALLGRGLDELDLKNRIRSRQAHEARMARTDALTGLPNRLALEEYLPQAIARAPRRDRAGGRGARSR